VVRINYPTLAKFLPVRVAMYASQAQQQLDPALALLVQTALIETVTWTKAKHGEPQLLLERGKRLERPEAVKPCVPGPKPEVAEAEDGFTARWLPVWEKLPEAEKSDICQRTRSKYPFLRLVTNDRTVDALCLQELAKDRSADG
jgi:hypothetical protein